MYGIIYKATNTINQKVYIGLTSKTLKHRKLEHLHRSKGTTGNLHYFQRALSKYGEDVFDWEVIDTAHSREELNEKEQLWITYYGSQGNGGYNLTSGGESNEGKKKEVYAFDLNGNLLSQYESASEAGTVYRCSPGSIGRVAKGFHLHKKEHVLLFAEDWASLKEMQEEVKRRKPYILKYKSKPIIAFNKELTSFEYLSIGEAMNGTGVRRSKIRRMLHNPLTKDENWYFLYKKDFPSNTAEKENLLENIREFFSSDSTRKEKTKTKRTKIFQYSVNGKLVSVYSNRKEAELATGYTYNEFWNCSNENRIQSHGFIWLLESHFQTEIERTQEIKSRVKRHRENSKKSIQILVLYPNGTRKTFPSQRKCAEAVGVSTPTIIRNLKSGKPTKNGIRFIQNHKIQA